MTKRLSLRQYAKKEIQVKRFPQINIDGCVGVWFVYDADWNYLKETFATRVAAEHARSKALDYANKFIAA